VIRKPTRDLSQVRLKLDRAKLHIETFGNEVEAFLKSDPPPFGFRTEESPGSGEAVEYVLYAIVRQPPRREFALIVGDAVQNMRIALEYLAYELSSPKARKAGTTSFPIYEDAAKFNPSGIATVKGDERTLIERVQPYAASKIPSDDPLAVLRKLSNLDKHQLLVPMIAAVSLRESWVASDNAEVRFHFIARGPIEHDTKIVAFTATPKDAALDMNVQPRSGLEIQLQNTGIVGFDISALDLLQMIEYHIRQTVIAWSFDYGQLPPTWQEVEASQQTT
jgi:hypothetical protein